MEVQQSKISNSFVSIIKNNPKNFECVYKNSKLPNFLPFLNAIKRISIADIPTFAIDKVIKYGDSAIDPDEKVVHKIGLIPLIYPGFEITSQFNTFPDCNCGELDFEEKKEDARLGCSKCTIEFRIFVECPPNEKSKPIRANDIQLTPGELPLSVLDSIYINGIEKKTNPIISYVTQGKTFDMTCYAMKNVGSVHSKWSPITVFGIKKVKKLQLNKKPIEKWTLNQKEEFVMSCPKKVFKLENAIVDIENSFPCDQCNECHDFCEKENLDTVVKIKNDDKIHFHLETVGSVRPIEILLIANVLLQHKCKNYIELLSQLEKSK